jgi:hypothetical protein
MARPLLPAWISRASGDKGTSACSISWSLLQNMLCWLHLHRARLPCSHAHHPWARQRRMALCSRPAARSLPSVHSAAATPLPLLCSYRCLARPRSPPCTCAARSKSPPQGTCYCAHAAPCNASVWRRCATALPPTSTRDLRGPAPYRPAGRMPPPDCVPAAFAAEHWMRTPTCIRIGLQACIWTPADCTAAVEVARTARHAAQPLKHVAHSGPAHWRSVAAALAPHSERCMKHGSFLLPCRTVQCFM